MTAQSDAPSNLPEPASDGASVAPNVAAEASPIASGPAEVETNSAPVNPEAETEPVVAASTSDASPDTRPIPPSWLWLREHDQAFVAVCIALFLLVGGYHWVDLSGWGAVPLEIDRQIAHRYDYKIDINSAGLIEWMQIEGIGEATARKILEDREAKGPFREIDDLKRVKGIGPATVAKFRPFLRDVETRPATDSKPTSSDSPPASE